MSDTSVSIVELFERASQPDRCTELAQLVALCAERNTEQLAVAFAAACLDQRTTIELLASALSLCAHLGEMCYGSAG